MTAETTKMSHQGALHAIKENRPRWLAITLFMLSALYLLPEAVFNAQLVTVAGGGSMDHQQLHLVELFGRTISGIGVSLLLADLLLKGALVRTLPRAITAFVVILALVWPTVFFGQKLLIDKLLVDPSSASQRQEAFFASILRSGLATNAVKITGLPYNANHAALPEEMTFLALMGGLVYANPDFMTHVASQKQAIVERYITNRAAAEFDVYYGRYQQLRQQINQGWQQYQQGMTRYRAAIDSAPQRADKAWEQVETEVTSGWQRYQQARQAYTARAEARGQELAPKIAELFDEKNECIERYNERRRDNERLNRCIAGVEEDYERVLKKYRLSFKPMDFWLIREQRRIKGETSLKETVMTLGLSAVLAGLEQLTGDGGKPDVKWVYSREVADYTPKILLLWQDKFKAETGYPMDIDSLKAFRSSAVTGEKIRQRLVKEGIKLPRGWHINQITQFQQAVTERVQREATRQWQREVHRHGWQMAPGLSWAQFQRSNDIQQRIKANMGDRYYVSPMLADWNNTEFYRLAILPNIKRETQHWVGFINASVSQFADGAPLAKQGKSALRSVLVPPISMSLSLLLVLLTALKLPVKAWQLISPQASSHKKRDMAISVLLMLMVFAVPLLALGSKFTAAGSTAGYFFHQVEQRSSPIVALTLRWVIHTQPMVQPLGAGVDGVLGITTGFKHLLEQPVGQLDNWLMPILLGITAGHNDTIQGSKTALVDDNGMLKLLPFTITTNAANNRIRIMNIKQRYQPGMKLPISHYDVEVSAPGYQTTRRWVEHHDGHGEYQINLSKAVL